MKTRFDKYCEEQRAQYGSRFVPPAGKDFIDAFNRGREFRVKVVTDYGNGEVRSRWGFVSLTTGWEPAFILMSRRNASGSSDVLDHLRDKIVDHRYVY